MFEHLEHTYASELFAFPPLCKLVIKESSSDSSSSWSCSILFILFSINSLVSSWSLFCVLPNLEDTNPEPIFEMKPKIIPKPIKLNTVAITLPAVVCGYTSPKPEIVSVVIENQTASSKSFIVSFPSSTVKIAIAPNVILAAKIMIR